jgi:arylsulfatase A-like enzyme
MIEKQPPQGEGCPGTTDPDISDKPFLLQTQTSCAGSNWKRSRWQASLQGVDNRLPQMISAFLARTPERPKKIIITSDHGHELGNHRHIAKEVPYEMTVRVPLFIYDSEAPGGTIDTLVNTLSLNPTIHEWAGSTPLLPPDADSLVPLYTGQSTSWPDHVYTSHLLVQNEIYDVRPWHAIRQDCSLRRDQDGDGNDDCFKLVGYPASSARLADGSTVALPTEWELYDLVEDPWELTQLLPNGVTGYPGQPGWDHATPIVADLMGQLQAHIAAGA